MITFLQALPGVVLSTPISAELPRPRIRKKIPDATNSPYFGLDRHLTQKTPSGRKRLLDEINDSGSPFITSQETQQRKLVANTSAHRVRGMNKVMSVDGSDLFGMSAEKQDASQWTESPDVVVADFVTGPGDYNLSPDDPSLLSFNTRSEMQHETSRPSRSSLGKARVSEPELQSNSGNKHQIPPVTDASIDGQSAKNPRYTTAESLRKSVGRMKA